MKKKKFAMLCCLVAAVAGGPASAHAEDSLIDWGAIFNADGSVRSLMGGMDAQFLQDNISAGVATDMTALTSDGTAVWNGQVSAAHDLGNGYVYAALDAEQNLVITAGVERINTDADTFVEFEFNQDVVRVTSGRPWRIGGTRTKDDCLVRFNFTSGSINTVELKKWDGSEYKVVRAVQSPFQRGCSLINDASTYCIGAPVPGLPPTNSDVWDSTFHKVKVPPADGFVQTSVNVGRLLGKNPGFSSISIKTPEDIVLGTFSTRGASKPPGKTAAAK